ncbi:Bestrophin, RFP-TM, chloride channel-domain-containing protein [Chytriomyces sp. MP71]|nr:Bestrophin, RFP-TM, chloride channel-domain-containing protein [Chytriomyces sp. MP71]
MVSLRQRKPTTPIAAPSSKPRPSSRTRSKSRTRTAADARASSPSSEPVTTTRAHQRAVNFFYLLNTRESLNTAYSVAVLVSIACAYASLVVVLATRGLPPPNLILVTCLAPWVSLLVVFRLNSAYDRFWEAAKLWSAVRLHIVNLARMVKVMKSGATTRKEDIQKKIHLKLLAQFPFYLQSALERAPTNPDRDPTVATSPLSKEPLLSPAPPTLPLHITATATRYLLSTRACTAAHLACLSALDDAATHLARLCGRTPPPPAYDLHLRQVLVLFLAVLPLQIAGALGWLAVVVQAIVAFAVLGVVSVSEDVEQVFGGTGVPMEMYCGRIREDMELILGGRKGAETESRLQWLGPAPLHQDSDIQSP